MNARTTRTMLVTTAVCLGLSIAPALAASSPDDTALATAVAPRPADYGKAWKPAPNNPDKSVCINTVLKPGSTAQVFGKGFGRGAVGGSSLVSVYSSSAAAAAAFAKIATDTFGTCLAAEQKAHSSKDFRFKSFSGGPVTIGTLGDHARAYTFVVKGRDETEKSDLALKADFVIVQRKRVVIVETTASAFDPPALADDQRGLKAAITRVA